MNSYNKIWKNISGQLKYAKKTSNEYDYQSAIYDIITDEDYLGWPADRVKREYPIQMGSTKKSDIVLLDSNYEPCIAIEVKLASSTYDGVEQLGSYMDRCNPRLEFGITIKDDISLFYDEDTGRSIHSIDDAILSASLEDSFDVEGIAIVENLSFKNFNEKTFKTYCEEKLIKRKKELDTKNKIRRVSNLLSGDSGKTIIQKALCQYLITENIIDAGEEDIVVEIINNISLNNSGHQSSSVYKGSHINYKFIPSKEEFVDYLRRGTCYRHFVLSDESIHTEPWKSKGSIIVETLMGNINSTLFYRNNKGNITEIILSPYQDPFKE